MESGNQMPIQRLEAVNNIVLQRLHSGGRSDDYGTYQALSHVPSDPIDVENKAQYTNTLQDAFRYRTIQRQSYNKRQLN